MANVIVTPQILTRATLMNLGGYLNVCRNMSKNYSSEFGKKTFQIGDTLKVRKPQRFETTENMDFTPEPLHNTQIDITIDKVAGVHFEYGTIEKTLELQDLNERYAKPAAIALAHKINMRAAEFAAQNTANAVGTPASVPNSMLTYLQAGDKLVALGLPENEALSVIISRKMSSTYVNAVAAVHNPAGKISSQYNTGRVPDEFLGYTWYLDQTLHTHTAGDFAGTLIVKGANQIVEGGDNVTQTFVIDGMTNTKGLKKGDRFTIADVYAVHPQTRQSTGELKQFIVLADVVAGADTVCTMSIAPGITPSGQYQNVNSIPADDAGITILGAANAVSPQALMLHKSAYAFLSVPLANPTENGVEMVAQETDPDTGVTLSFIRQFDGIKRRWINRFDCLYGFGVLYREMACVICS